MKKELNKKKLLIVSIIILLIIIIIISLLIKKINKTETEVNNVIDTRTEEQKEDEKIKKLKQSSESDRIKTYVGTYFKYIEQGNLEKAYELLYPSFKEKYFPEYEDYEKYIKSKYFPEVMAIQYKEISTQGQYYLVTVNITDLVNPYNKTTYTQNLTLIEQDYNDYYISFVI